MIETGFILNCFPDESDNNLDFQLVLQVAINQCVANFMQFADPNQPEPSPKFPRSYSGLSPELV